ncbi:MAG: hypothetical protein EOR85_30770 [Mesorhizobium sp.]|uniref:hypothetical protein n=1 Tax=Mesorhizobium sp. TaxID=1871066 RepID=UPI000FE568FD|nr:hypothetical protein [Mesorhizobium sp.]RWM54059.1 MAG: hypothetical protein EOR79_25205 [Mesorhizobium sp.]RWM90550.1 MAG: hypothetical protein EOR85_30770 [Mesorhizobium sp.]TIM85276.1 MAG: hypothetical protein E5Y50_19340 [Mesorhizobium sp.]
MLDLEHCYGIKKLKADLDFSKKSAIAIYAPNGAMKSSLAKTFQDIADEENSGDRIFKDRINKRVVTDEKGTALPPEKALWSCFLTRKRSVTARRRPLCW